MNRVLKKIHRWLGFPIGILFLITFGTGFLTALNELISRDLSFEKKMTAGLSSDFVYRETSLIENAQQLTELTQLHKDIRQIIMPTQQRPYYQLIKRGEVWFYSIDELILIGHHTREQNGFYKTVLQLHRNFLLGKKELFGIGGEDYVAWVSIFSLVISCIGLWLWWPMRKTFKLKKLVPNNNKRASFYYSHMSSGVVVFLLIVLMSLTGVSITYRSFTQNLFGISQDKNIQQISRKNNQLEKLDNNWFGWLTSTSELIPDGKLVSIRFTTSQVEPRQASSINQSNANKLTGVTGQQILIFRLSRPSDWLGLAGNTIKINSSDLTSIEHSIFSEQSFGTKLFSLLKPLHTGRDLHFSYVVLLLVLSGLGVVMVFSGIASFVVKRRRGVVFQWIVFKRVRA